MIHMSHRIMNKAGYSGSTKPLFIRSRSLKFPVIVHAKTGDYVSGEK